MTTIAWDGRNLAADGLIHTGGRIDQYDFSKIKVKDKHLFTCAGDITLFAAAIDWYLKTVAHPEYFPRGKDSAITLWVFDGKSVTEYENGYPFPIQAPAAIGSGAGYALAVMNTFDMMGADGIKDLAGMAVQIACRTDIYSGGLISSVDTVEWVENGCKSPEEYQEELEAVNGETDSHE